MATIAAWLEGLTADNQSTSTCQPRKLELPIIPKGGCTVPLHDSQNCVGVRGSPSPLCRVRSNYLLYSRFPVHFQVMKFSVTFKMLFFPYRLVDFAG